MEFWSRKTFTPAGCWEWSGKRTGKGYGQLTIRGKEIYAHRHAWEITNGGIPAGRYVMHDCDNPPCINPQHLRIGTPQDNADDMFRKGRDTLGGRVLIERGIDRETFRDAFLSGLGWKDLGEKFAMSKSSLLLLTKELGLRRNAPPLTEGQKREILRLKRAGWKITRIASELGVAYSQAYRLQEKSSDA